jgi:hypothetical protein
MSDSGRGGADPAEPEPDVEPSLEPESESEKPSGRGTIVSITTVVGLLLATALTVLGVGAADNAVASFDASTWMWSSQRSEVDRVNGVTARVDTRTRIKDAQNHEIHISQTDKYLVLRDLTTGQVSALDLTTLQISAVMPTTPGLGVSVALHGEAAFVIDSVQGQVRQLDPRSLAPSGDSLTFPPGLAPGAFDGKGTLWVGVPSEGTVVAIVPSVNGNGPKVVRTVTVAPPNHDLVLTVLDQGVAVLDNTQATLMTVLDDRVDAVSVPIDKPALLPARSSGSAVPLTVSEDRRVYVVENGHVRDFTVPGSGSLSPAVSFAGHVYCADPVAGVVYEFDGRGAFVKQFGLPAAGGGVELEVRENYLFINAPDGSTARVVNERHQVKEVNKHENGVLGGDPPPPPPKSDPPKPSITTPGRPQNVSASAGDETARITWRRARDNGSPITKYVVEGAGLAITVGARQRAVTITGLVNGTTYRFTVHAVNKKGAGPKGTSNPVKPTRDVPDPPATVTATEKPDGSVVVTWPPANGQGRKIVRYTVTSVSGGAQAPVGDVRTNTMTIPPGSLTYGTQYAFTVVTVNDLNAGSQPSPLSNIIVPYAAPGRPRNLTAATDPAQRGAIQVSWQMAPDNGRPITKYVVDAGGKTQDVTGTSVTLAGFGDDTAVPVKVHAVNQAGDGPDAAANARTIGIPTLTWTSDAAGYNSVSATFTPNNRGGAAVCRLQVAGAGTAQANCTTQPVSLTVNGLWPNNTYSYTVSVTSAAGAASATRSRATNQMRFTVICPNNNGGYCNSGIWAYRVPSQQSSGQAVNPSLSVGATHTPQCHIAGDNVNATPWGGRNSSRWLRFSYGGGPAYFPYAWARLDGPDSVGSIPAC